MGRNDVVIDCVGMDGKKSPLEFLEQKLKLQGGTLGPIQISTKAVRKYGTVQLTGVYGGNYNAFPLGRGILGKEHQSKNGTGTSQTFYA